MRSQQVFEYLDTVGNGTGSTDGAVDGSGTDVVLKYTAVEETQIARMIVHIRDNAAFRASYYGAISGGLTNGILVQVTDASGTIDLCAGVPIKANAGWSRVCYDVSYLDFGAGDNFLGVRWTFAKSGRPLVLEPTDVFSVTIQDDCSTLVEHTFFIQGHKE